MTVSIYDIQQNDLSIACSIEYLNPECHDYLNVMLSYAECHYAKGRFDDCRSATSFSCKKRLSKFETKMLSAPAPVANFCKHFGKDSLTNM
jgi:hypothetical protein